MKKLFLLVALIGLCACGRPDTRQVRTPNGYLGVAIKCRHAIDCMEIAGEQCPTGYEIIGSEHETEAKAAVSQTFGWASVEESGTILIECRAKR